MNNNAKFITWNLEEIIGKITTNHQEIGEMYLFGSRAYKTGSYRSDIDLLAICDAPIPVASINAWLHDAYPPVDLFLCNDGKTASSVVNGSVLSYREGSNSEDLIHQLDAIKLWGKDEGLSKDYVDWNVQTLSGIDFIMSVIPSYPMSNIDKLIENAMCNLRTAGIIPFFSGKTWREIGNTIAEMVEIAMKKPSNYQTKAKNYSFDKLVIKNEYDFQNYIHTVLRPVFPDIEPEPVTITIDGNEKKADFALNCNKVIIEAKWIEDTSKKDQVLKCLDGLSSFYSENPRACCLVFLILYDEKKVDINSHSLEHRFSKVYDTPPIIVRFIPNEFLS